MLLKSYSMNIVRAKCNPGSTAVHCMAGLDQDVSSALPYLNARLHGFEYFKDPPAVTFRMKGRRITVEGLSIAISSVSDEEEAREILDWMQNEINAAWDAREETTPSYSGAPKPQVITIFKYLPRTNCKKCGSPTCMAFAAQVASGAASVESCPELAADARLGLVEYMESVRLP